MDILLQQPRELWFKTSVLWAHQLTAKWHVNADVWESTPWTFQKDYPVHTFLYKHLLRWKDQWGVNSTTVMDVLKRRGLILPVKKHHCMMTWSWRDQRRMLSLLCVCVCVLVGFERYYNHFCTKFVNTVHKCQGFLWGNKGVGNILPLYHCLLWILRFVRFL